MKTKLYALVQQHSVAKNNDVELSLRDTSEKAGDGGGEGWVIQKDSAF